MIKMRELSKAKMLELYEKNLLIDVVYAGDRIIGKSTEGQINNPVGFEVVFCLS